MTPKISEERIGRQPFASRAFREIERLEQQIFLFRLVSRVAVVFFLLMQLPITVHLVGGRPAVGFVLSNYLLMAVFCVNCPLLLFCVFWQISERDYQFRIERALSNFVEYVPDRRVRDEWINYVYSARHFRVFVGKVQRKYEPAMWGYVATINTVCVVVVVRVLEAT